MIRPARYLVALAAVVAATAFIAACNGGTDNEFTSPCGLTISCTTSGGGGNESGVAAIQLGPFPDSMVVGDTATLTATALDSTGNPVAGASITYASSAPTVATITGSGSVTARAAGTTTLTASAGSATASLFLTVIQ